MKREAGHYCSTWSLYDAVEVVFFDGDYYWRQGVSIAYREDHFSWISDKPIVLEKPPIKMVVNSWYLFSNGVETMVGQYQKNEFDEEYIWVGKGIWFHYEAVTILGGPFTTKELSQRK